MTAAEKREYKKLKIKYADVLNNKELQDFCNGKMLSHEDYETFIELLKETPKSKLE